ncbi:hypothetical protein BH11CYA1_BH11CYA1_17690 [soil metagenome]
MKVRQTLLALLVGLSSAYWSLAAMSIDKPDYVLYQFPNIPSLGTLETRVGSLGGGPLGRIASRRHVVASAIGTVKIPMSENQGIYFTPGPGLTVHPELLDSISPANIEGFFFSFTSTGDSEDDIADKLVARISHLKNLRSLKLGRCDVSDIGAKGIHDLPQLKLLDMSFSLISRQSVPILGKLAGLEDVILNSVDLSQSDFSSFGRLPNLSTLFLRGSKVSDAMVSSLRPCKNLQYLDLSNNHDVTDASLAALALLPKLKTVALSGTAVNIGSLTKLARIERVVVSRRDLKGAKLQELRKAMPNLVLDMDSKVDPSKNKLDSEELHLFAPTRY